MQLVAIVSVALLLVPLSVRPATPSERDAAAAFGARPTVTELRLSPDGKTVAYISPTTGRGSMVYARSLVPGSKPRIVLTADGNPDRIQSCNWVSNERLVCSVYFIVREQALLTLQYVARMVAMDSDGGNPRILSKRTSFSDRGVDFRGGQVIDWLPDQDGMVLMTRFTIPNDRLGTKLGTVQQGLGVDMVDTRTLATTSVEPPIRSAVSYISDGRGTVRVMALDDVHRAGYEVGSVNFEYRKKGSRDWLTLGKYDYVHHEGFEPVAVDPDLNVAYGFKKKDGRRALFTIALDGTLTESLVFSRDDVDLDDLARIGRRQRVVGVSFATDYPKTHYFDPAVEKVVSSIARALSSHPAVSIADSSVDDSKLLIYAGSDNDAGLYYLFDRPSNNLETFLVVRSELENVKLATVKPISYPAADGTPVPGYLTLPPGAESAKGLPAIVMPHGGPSARDEWGFDWLAQYYASRGFAVLQPNFRGSAGYGDAWFHKNGFRSWKLAIGDVLDAGRWLVSQGIADPGKLAIVGWSYGGYAALQSAITDPAVFKAVVAIAPVTDLIELKEQHRHWTDFTLVSDFVGDGIEAREASPNRNAAKIRVPVLIFHGADDINVHYAQSQMMDQSLSAANVKHELVTFDHLDHYLEDSTVRAEMLRKSEAFLRQSLGL